MEEGSVPSSSLSRGYTPYSDKMLLIAVRDLGNGVDRVEHVDYVDRADYFPACTEPIDVDDLWTRDLIYAAAARMGFVCTTMDPILGGGRYEKDGLIYIAAWACINPLYDVAPFQKVTRAA